MPRPGKTEQQRRAEQAAGLHICDLLRQPGLYRDLWEAAADEIKPDSVNQAAVCQVLARYLWDASLEPETRTDLPRSLKDPVSKALRGVSLSPNLLRTFIAAFNFSVSDADRTRLLYRGEERPSVIVGVLPPPSEVPGYRSPEFDTLKLQEHHWLGPDGLPARHRTEIMIRSRVDGLASYQYRIDTPHARVRAVRGGKPGAMYNAGGGIWAVELMFPRPLLRGEERYIEFWTLLKYDTAPPREMRRGTHERIDHLDIRVEFHPNRLPSRVFWAEWEHYVGPENRVIGREEFRLDNNLVVHRYVDAVERTVVGFYWDW
ncbi:hypothetical protein [Amycolatopsis samaneae]|uniref:Uncharacterized protein n=1 Tax=Amycolatopsis samaneae TaxID=664691 RepID=A0ABW5GI61_9PSEU